MKQAKQIAATAYQALADKKAEDIKVIDISRLSVMADYFVIANGANTPHVEALVDNVAEALEKQGVPTPRIEGIRSSGWILMDYGDVIVHVFSKEDRLFYDLERIWRDGAAVGPEELTEE